MNLIQTALKYQVVYFVFWRRKRHLSVMKWYKAILTGLNILFFSNGKSSSTGQSIAWTYWLICLCFWKFCLLVFFQYLELHNFPHVQCLLVDVSLSQIHKSMKQIFSPFNSLSLYIRRRSHRCCSWLSHLQSMSAPTAISCPNSGIKAPYETSDAWLEWKDLDKNFTSFFIHKKQSSCRKNAASLAKNVLQFFHFVIIFIILNIRWTIISIFSHK